MTLRASSATWVSLEHKCELASVKHQDFFIFSSNLILFFGFSFFFFVGEKVGAGNVCLWCNEKGRSFYSTEAVQSHMTDKSHCKLLTDGDAALEFADFYDFR